MEKVKNLKILSVLFGLLCFSTQILCQQLTNVYLPSSPNSSEFEKFGKIDIGKGSLYHGALTFALPLHEIKGPKLNHKLQLNYVTTGITLFQSPTWVGLGWNLNVGGVITRTIKGKMMKLWLQEDRIRA